MSLPDVATPEVRKAGGRSATRSRPPGSTDSSRHTTASSTGSSRISRPTGSRAAREATAWDGYVANVVADAALDSLHHGGRIPVTLNEQPALYR